MENLFNKYLTRRDFNRISSRSFLSLLFSFSGKSVNANELKKQVLLLTTDEDEISYYELFKDLKNPNPPNKKDIIKSRYLSHPLVEIGYDESETVYLPGLNPRLYDLTVRVFNDKDSFFKNLVDKDIPPLDELIINCHGMPLYLEVNRPFEYAFGSTEGRVLDDLKYSELCDEKLLRQRILKSDYHPLPLDYDIKKYMISVEDLRNLDDGIVKKIRAKLNKNAHTRLISCLSFANLCRQSDEYPVFGVELAKVLDRPVTGSVPSIYHPGIKPIGSDKKEILTSSRNWVTAVPYNGKVEISGFDKNWCETNPHMI